MIRNFKRTAAIFGIVAATSTALVACSEESGSSSDSAGGEDVSGELVGDGASSQQNAMSYFQTAFSEDHPDASLSYNASGSGAGVEAFTNGQADFAGSDSALKEDEGEVEAAAKRCDGNEAWHLPTTIGPVAIAYNLGDTEINLSTKTLGKIFKGEIKKWNDKAIAADNEGTDLPDKDITVIFRSDESGTSANFQKFLKAATGDWDSEGKQFPDAVGEGANGSSGVADQVVLDTNDQPVGASSAREAFESPAFASRARSHKLPLYLEQKCHRPIVDQMHLHIGAEASGSDLRVLGPSQLDQTVEQSCTLRRRCSAGEAGAHAALGVGCQGELRDQQ